MYLRIPVNTRRKSSANVVTREGEKDVQSRRSVAEREGKVMLFDSIMKVHEKKVVEKVPKKIGA